MINKLFSNDYVWEYVGHISVGVYACVCMCISVCTYKYMYMCIYGYVYACMPV